MQGPSTIYAMTSARQKMIDAYPPLRGPGGVRLASYHPNALVTTSALNITTKCRNPEVVIRWVDWFYDHEGLMTMRIGREGIEWDWAKPGTLSYTGAPALWINIGAQGGSTNEFWMQYGMASYNRHSLQLGVSDDLFYEAEGLNTRLYAYTRDHYMMYKPDRYVPPMYFEDAVIRPVSQNISDIASYRNQMWARFITGDLPLNDANWNTYVRTLDQMGIPAILAAYQKTYETHLKNTGN